MAIDLLDDKVQHKFSESSIHYDALASLHREIGRELYGKMHHVEACDNILDIGMGTGWMTNRLTHIFPDSKVIGLDFAHGMIDVAKKREGDFSILQADARRLPFQDNSFNIITSNLAYQWIGDLTQTFKECRRVLTEGGQIYMTMFGFNTFQELFESLRFAYGAAGALPIDRLYSLEEIKSALKTGAFNDAEVKVENIQVRFPDMLALIKWIKGIGANGLKKDIYIGKDLLQRAENYYKQKYTDRFGIYATFEIIWIVG